MIEFIKKYVFQILTVTFLLLYLKDGCTSTKISKMDKNIIKHIDSLETRLHVLESKSFTKKELYDDIEKIMFDFLIYEDDLDKGKTSLSSIKNKIESND
jgi:hypothetical protein